MAKRKILRWLYFVATLPYFTISKIVYFFNWFDMRRDLANCGRIIEESKNTNLSKHLITVLKIAEDHRNDFHFGIDHFALLRAAYHTSKGEIQGASTIEQQFVRVATKKYQRTINRKFKEQLLAVLISSLFEKNEIASAYLCIAYYGVNKMGVSGIKMMSLDDVERLTIKDSIPIISRLKYPEPLLKSNDWDNVHDRRNQFLFQKIEEMKATIL